MKNISEMSPEAYAVEQIWKRKTHDNVDVTEIDVLKEFEKLRPNEEEYAVVSALIIRNFYLGISDVGEEVAIMLIDAGVEVNSLLVHETAPLQMAVLYGRERLVRKLLDHNANPFVQGLLGFTPLQIAEIRAANFPQDPVFSTIAGMIETEMKQAKDAEMQQTHDQLNNGKQHLKGEYIG